jgi:hypothetical protein
MLFFLSNEAPTGKAWHFELTIRHTLRSAATAGGRCTSSAPIKIEDVEGNAHVTTSNGSVHLAKIRGNVDAHTSNGGVELTDVWECGLPHVQRPH